MPLISFGQEASTTVEEYNFLTEGLKDIKSKGLDQKKDGYALEVFFETIPNYKVKSKVSYKFRTLKNSKGELKALGVEMIFSPTSSNFYCIPINNAELSKKYVKEFDNLMTLTQQQMHMAVAEALTFLAGKK